VIIVPEVPNNNTKWDRGGRLNEKVSIELTEEQQKNIAACDGIKREHPCKNPVFVCSHCGNYGCSQEIADKCTKQGFKNDKCLKCGNTGTRQPVMKDEYSALQA
jgi:hypothetical protein